MKEINIKELTDNVVKLIGEDWSLITAGDLSSFNTMTASWGGIGFLWNRPVAYIFIRPERYTHSFVEKNTHFTLSFFDEKYRNALNICGSKSGRDTDKVAEAGLDIQSTAKGNIYFSQARVVLECRKFYSVEIKDGEFVEKQSVEKWYKKEGIHTMYIGEIEHCYVGDE